MNARHRGAHNAFDKKVGKVYGRGLETQAQ